MHRCGVDLRLNVQVRAAKAVIELAGGPEKVDPLIVRSRRAGPARAGRAQTGPPELMARADGVAAAAGLEFRHADAPHARTVDAHRLLHLALAEGRQGELKEALLSAYFTRGESMGDHDVLRKVAVDAGLDPGRVDE